MNQSEWAPDAVGRMMDPVVAAFRPEQTVAATVDKLRDMVKEAFITYVYVTDAGGRLLGIVTPTARGPSAK